MFEWLYSKIEWLVIKKELRDRIADLRLEGNLREKTYQKLQSRMILNTKLTITFLLILLVLMLLADFPLIMNLPILGFFSALSILSLRGKGGGKPALFYTTGTPEIAHVTFFFIPFRMSHFNISYVIKKNEEEWIIKDTGKTGNLVQKGFKKHPYLDPSEESMFRLFQKGDPILVFITPSSRTKAMVYYPAHFDAYCLDKIKFEETQKFINIQEGLINV